MPVGEAAEVFEDPVGIGPKIMRAVVVQEHTGGILKVVAIASDVIAPVDDEAGFSALGGEAFGKHGAGETRAHH